MKKIIAILLGLTVMNALAVISQPKFSVAVSKEIAMPTPKVIDFSQQPPIGELGQPLGKITTISGVVQQSALGAKASKLDLVLLVNIVNDRPLPKPIIIPFEIFSTAKVTKPFLGQPFTYVGYETGGFTGVPGDAFKWVPAIATTGHHFETVYQILHEALAQVKTKADLVKWNNQRVQVIGKYLATSKQKLTRENANVVDPITGNPRSQASNTTVNIVLADSTRVPLHSPLLKQSNRPSQEVKTFNGKMVSIVGKLASESIGVGGKLESTITIVSMDSIELY